MRLLATMRTRCWNCQSSKISYCYSPSLLYQQPLRCTRVLHEASRLKGCNIRRGFTSGWKCSAQASVDSGTDNSGVEYVPTIGIETHVQLKTQTKAFCRCRNQYGQDANSNVCPVCMGQPGTLPVLNQEVVKYAIRAGLAINGKISQLSKFDRKQYFYPDLPKGYQISQYDVPICTNGSVEINLPGKKKTIDIERLHIEEDSGKSVYSGADGLAGSEHSLVDYNRAGVPLLEIVTSPNMSSGEEAAAYGAELRRIMTFLGISDGNMAEGSLRCDVNVSVAKKDADKLGTKVEVKNMNSFSNMQKAIDFEVERQTALLKAERSEEITQETRLWDEGQQETYTMRKKEGLADYRYFPEPDLPPLNVEDSLIKRVQESMPELPAQRRVRYQDLGLPNGDVLVLTDEAAIGNFFDSTMIAGADSKAAANWIIGDITAFCKSEKIAFGDLLLMPEALAEMVKLIGDGVISGKIGKQVLPDLLMGKGNSGVRQFIEGKGLLQISDVGQIEEIIDSVMAANPKQVEQFQSGKDKLFGFFIGQIMKESKGRANPGIVNKLLTEKLKGP